MRFLRWLVDAIVGGANDVAKAAGALGEPGTPSDYLPRVKFPAGTRWTCPDCGSFIGTAKRDICYGDRMASSEWQITDAESFFSFRHCVTARRMSPDGHIQFHTPAGWIG